MKKVFYLPPFNGLLLGAASCKKTSITEDREAAVTASAKWAATNNLLVFNPDSTLQPKRF